MTHRLRPIRIHLWSWAHHLQHTCYSSKKGEEAGGRRPGQPALKKVLSVPPSTTCSLPVSDHRSEPSTLEKVQPRPLALLQKHLSSLLPEFRPIPVDTAGQKCREAQTAPLFHPGSFRGQQPRGLLLPAHPRGTHLHNSPLIKILETNPSSHADHLQLFSHMCSSPGSPPGANEGSRLGKERPCEFWPVRPP